MTLPTTAAAIRRAVASGHVSATEVCRAALDRIRRANGTLNAFRYVDEEGALARAAEIDSRLDELMHLPLLGVPVALKDNICTRRMPTTASSRDPRGLSSALRRRGGRTARERRRGDCRQDQLRRIRDGVVDRELGLRRDPQPVESGADSRRIERRLGGRGGRAAGAARARFGHRRIDPAAGGALRSDRPQAHLRPRLTLRPAGVRVVARSDRSDRDDGRRCGAGDQRAGGTRSAGRDLGRQRRCPISPAR